MSSPPGVADGGVLLQIGEPAVGREPDIGHAGLFHVAPSANVLGEADRDDLLETTRLEAVAQDRLRGLGAVALVPRDRQVVVRELDLGPGPLDRLQRDAADELTCRPQGDVPARESTVPLDLCAPLDKRACGLERRGWPGWKEAPYLGVAVETLELRRVVRRDGANDEPLGLEPHRSSVKTRSAFALPRTCASPSGRSDAAAPSSCATVPSDTTVATWNSFVSDSIRDAVLTASPMAV